MSIIRTNLLFIVVILASSCSSFLYYPSKKVFVDPKKMKMKPMDVYLQVGQEKVHGWYFKVKKPTALVVFFHGNAQNISSHFLALAWLPKLNVDYFIFDYPGYGKSSGIPTPSNTVESGIAAINWGLKKAQERGVPLTVYAQSLGGAVAMRSLAEMQKIDCMRDLVVDSTFLSYKKTGSDIFSKAILTWPFQWLPYLVLSDKYAPKGHLHKLEKYNLTVIHGKKDQIIRYHLGEDVFKSFKGKKQLWAIPNGRHTDSFWRKDQTYGKRFYKLITDSNLTKCKT
jgi:fermentation-respiration switch protein FrsA (DUF1100 family)